LNSLSAIGAAPPPRPRPKRWSPKYIALTIVGIFALVSGGLFLVRYLVIRSGITEIPDNMFGDQHLKTSVALIELHRVRYGKYPDLLSDLKFTGQWDQIALQSVRYYPNPLGRRTTSKSKPVGLGSRP